MSDAVRGDVARGELDGLGLKHFLDVRATARRLLGSMDRWQRAAFAAAVTQRLLRTDLAPGGEHADVSFWRPVLAAIWRGLAGEPAASRQVAAAVGQFYLSPSFTGRGHDDPGDADDHAIMAACYTGECLLHGCLEFAVWTGWRGFDAATLRAAADVAWPHRRPPAVTAYAWELAHPEVQAELDQQLVDLELLAPAEGEPADRSAARRLLERLRAGAAAVPAPTVGPRFDDARAAGPSQRVADAERQLGGSRVGEPVIEPVEETPEAAAAVDDEAPLPALAPPERATQGPSFVEPTRQPDDQPPP